MSTVNSHQKIMDYIYFVAVLVICPNFERTALDVAKKLGIKMKTEEEMLPTMVSIYRYDPDECDGPYIQDYEIEPEDLPNHVLEALIFIKNEIDPTLTFRRSCREGKCGSCAMNINGINGLACITPTPREGRLKLFPLPHAYVIKDLVVDLSHFYNQYKTIQPWLQRKTDKRARPQEHLQSLRDRKKLDGLYECVLCGCCSFACPTYWHHGSEKKGFLGPAAILQAYRWIMDSRDQNHAQRLEKLRKLSSINRCRKVINCTMACPKNLNPAKAIMEVMQLIEDIDEKEEPDLEKTKAIEDEETI